MFCCFGFGMLFAVLFSDLGLRLLAVFLFSFCCGFVFVGILVCDYLRFTCLFGFIGYLVSFGCCCL